jgi:hypothetical protein
VRRQANRDAAEAIRGTRFVVARKLGRIPFVGYVHVLDGATLERGARRRAQRRTEGEEGRWSEIGRSPKGREAGRRLAWGEAYTSLSLADQSSSLEGADLELLAAAAYLLGHADECRQTLQRAHRAHIAAGDVRRAARGLFWVAFTLLLEGNLAVAGGWLAKAGRILDQEPRECGELGLLLLPSVVQASIEGDHAQAEAAARRAAEIGGRFGDADLFALGVHFQGRALLKLGRVREGLALLDEAMISVVTGEVWPPWRAISTAR